jgi:hypothetical protein
MLSLKQRDVENMDESRAIVLLNACNDAISGLHEKLLEQNRQKHLLEQRILAVRGQRSLLSRIPDELLLEIFKQVTCEDSLALGPILLVCSKWYNLTVNSPSLWATVCLSFQSALSAAEIRRRTRYVKSVMRNSNEAPLDIDLTLPYKYHLVETMLDKLFVADDSSDDSDDERSNDGERSDNLYNWLGEAIDNDPEDLLLYKDVSEGLSRFMGALAGSGGENLLRLRRFKFDYNSIDFDAPRWATALHYPTPNLEEINIETSYHVEATLLFIHPAPKLSVISIGGIHPINQLLHQDQPVSFLRLELGAGTTFDHFPNNQLLGNLKHLCITLYPFDADADTTTEGILLPSLETLTLWGRTHGSHCIKAPRLETLRLFGSVEFELDLPHALHLPSVKRIHYRWGSGEGDIDLLTTYISQFPLVKEVAVLHREKAKVVAVLAWMKGNSAYNDILRKGYQTEWVDLQPWSPPYPYESDEIQKY